MSESWQRENPYVGPRAFERGETLHGRDRELRRLLNLLIAERIVLLYSPSGAGKTSLIQAALIPELEDEGFRVWSTLRVNRELPPGETAGAPVNRYVLSVLLSLDEALPQDAQTPIDELTGMTLDDYLSQRTNDEAEAFDDVFVFDQFEEILTFDPTDREVKLEFFEQLGAMLQNRRRWALFAMREEFIAGLDPYLRPIPTRFSATFRLELLNPLAASQAMQKPASAAGVQFTDGAARQLVDDLRTVRVLQPDGTMEKRLGLHVEPVQLQVVCRHLWDRLRPPEGAQIVEADLEAVGDVDRALADFYGDQVAAIAGETGTSERTIREWIEGQLITEQGIRGQVLQGPEGSRGLDNPVIWRLVDAHLVRAENRRGATWFELAHDRLIEPVRGDNAVWREARLSVLQRQAALWEENGRPGGLLLHGEALIQAEDWAESHKDELTSVERGFLAACRAARDITEREHRQARRIRWLAVGATVFSVIAIVLAIFAGLQTAAARASARREADAKSIAKYRLYDAQTAEANALSAAESEAEARQRSEELQATQAVLLAVVLELQSSASSTSTVNPGDTTPSPSGASATPALNQTATVQAVETQSAGVQATWTAVAMQATSTAAAVQATAAAVTAPRPAILVQDGHFFTPPAGWEILDEKREQIEHTLQSVGRIEVSGSSSYEWLGTGFLAGTDVVMTAGSVAAQLCELDENRKWVFRPKLAAQIDFSEEWGGIDAAEFELTDIIGIHEDLDLALFRVAHTSWQGDPLPDPLAIASQVPDPMAGRRVYVVGYPARDPRIDSTVMAYVFSDIYDVKRLQPGEIIEVAEQVPMFSHDCFTLGGNGGSPVVDLETNQVLGLSFGGRYQPETQTKQNAAVSLWQLTDDPLLREAEVNFD
jgi:V8-like Glu-specific endopeptidase